MVIIIDMQNDFCKPDGTMYVGPRVAETLTNIRRLLERARPLAIPIVYVQSLRNAASPEIAVYGMNPYVMEGTWGSRIDDEIKPNPGDHLVAKRTHDCFHETTMDTLLTRLGAEPFTHNIMVCGVNTATCVYHAVIGFHIRHYNVYLPTDCTASRGETPGLMVLALLDRPAYNFNVTLTASEIIEFEPTEKLSSADLTPQHRAT